MSTASTSAAPKDVPWYNSSPPNIPAPFSELLTTYSSIPSEQQEDHVISIREKAYAIHPYPCLGLWAFLRLHLPTSPLFPDIVKELQTGSDALFVDLGAGLGQEIRTVIAAGAPADKVLGVELNDSFIDLGYELFNDQEKLQDRFISGDILLDSGDKSLVRLKGKVSVLYAASFLHLWNWEGQINVATRMVSLMQNRKGVKMLGRQIGGVVAKEKVHETNLNGGTMWKHDPDSFRRLWDEVGEKTGTKWEVTAELGKAYVKKDERTGVWWHDPDTRTIIWSIVRVE